MNRHLYYLLCLGIAVTVPGAMACKRTNDPDHELRRRLEAQAASEATTVTVSLGYIHQFNDADEVQEDEVQQKKGQEEVPMAASPDRTLHARAKGDEEIEISEFYLVTSAVELHICEQDYDPIFGRLERLQQWLLPSAHAHVPSSATRLGVPFVENLLGPPAHARVVGSIAPPFFNYCRLYAILSPADDDILNLTQLDTEQIEHKTMRIVGRVRTESNQPWQPFTLESAERRVIEMQLIAPATGQPPLIVAATTGHALILIEKTIDHAIFDGLELESILDGTAATIVLDRVIPSFRIHEFN